MDTGTTRFKHLWGAALCLILLAAAIPLAVLALSMSVQKTETLVSPELETEEWSGRTVLQPCFRADTVRSGAGAGDTSIAAFLAAVLSGRKPENCVALACAEGACCVTTYDALSGLKPLDELEERIRKGW